MSDKVLLQKEVDQLRKRLRQEELESDIFATMYANKVREYRKLADEYAELAVITRELRKQNRALRKRNIKRKLDFSE